jgi:hypothetical protein
VNAVLTRCSLCGCAMVPSNRMLPGYSNAVGLCPHCDTVCGNPQCALPPCSRGPATFIVIRPD